ncbi:MAG: hypothetical protein KY429_09125 [Actinobacteria bacterium]|nr:hypothetical protein [Actinomycetota bacterium]
MGLLDRVGRSPLHTFDLPVGDLTLHIQASDELQDEARASALKHWEQLESYLVRDPGFKTSFVSLPVGPDAPPLIKVMADASAQVGVGPMVTLPGAFVEAVAEDLAKMTKEVVVSAEGDSFVISDRPRSFIVEPAYGGKGIAIRVRSERYGFYASNGRLKVSPAIGKARCVGVLAEHCALADAVGSAMGLSMHRPQDVEQALEVPRKTSGIEGAMIVGGGRIGVWGNIEVVTPSGR